MCEFRYKDVRSASCPSWPSLLIISSVLCASPLRVRAACSVWRHACPVAGRHGACERITERSKPYRCRLCRQKQLRDQPLSTQSHALNGTTRALHAPQCIPSLFLVASLHSRQHPRGPSQVRKHLETLVLCLGNGRRNSEGWPRPQRGRKMQRSRDTCCSPWLRRGLRQPQGLCSGHKGLIRCGSKTGDRLQIRSGRPRQSRTTRSCRWARASRMIRKIHTVASIIGWPQVLVKDPARRPKISTFLKRLNSTALTYEHVAFIADASV